MIIVQDYMQEVINESYKRWAWTKMYGSAFGPQSFLYQLFEFFSYHPSRISFTPPPRISFFVPGAKVWILRTELLVVRKIETAQLFVLVLETELLRYIDRKISSLPTLLHLAINEEDYELVKFNMTREINLHRSLMRRFSVERSV
jgi:hypothetical protein